ncbi:MAG TPA: hypothetical protein VHS55_01975 [Solirubrobacteraceae bacterium]|jgi:hypothetical protein|nr:hypothetical protein [Solirubrobacteraceae bacterium]
MSRPELSAHDPQIAILAELEAELERELALLRPAPSPAPRWPDRRSLRSSARVARRALVLLALLSLIGATALAGRSVVDHPKSASSPPTLLAAGGSGGESWQFEDYAYRGEICYALFLDQTVASACSRPLGGAEVHALSGSTANRRFVAGLVGAEVAGVRVRVGDRVALAVTHPQRGGTAAERPLRWFVVAVPAAGGPAGKLPASVTPRAADGRPLAPATLECAGAPSGRCVREAERVAAGQTPAGQ